MGSGSPKEYVAITRLKTATPGAPDATVRRPLLPYALRDSDFHWNYFSLSLSLFPEDAAMAVEFSDEDSSSVSAGGVTITHSPQVARNLRRSSIALSRIGRFSWATFGSSSYLIDVQLNVRLYLIYPNMMSRFFNRRRIRSATNRRPQRLKNGRLRNPGPASPATPAVAPRLVLH
jgi:hypothetical protein